MLISAMILQTDPMIKSRLNVTSSTRSSRGSRPSV